MSARDRLHRLGRLPGLRRVAPAVKDLAVTGGLMSYKPMAWQNDDVEVHYESGAFDYFGGLDETPRYGIMLGYLTYFGGCPQILDVGCGTGLLRRRLGGVDFESYVGIDPAEASISAARELTDDRTHFVVGDILTTEVGRHDVAILNEILYMAPDPLAILDRLLDVLEPSALLLTSMMRHPGDKQLWAEIDARFLPIDAVTVRNESNQVARRGWRMTAHRRP